MLGESRGSGKARSDFLTAVFAVTVLYLLASILDVNEGWVRWAADLEQWELDEVPVALFIASAAVAWYAYRRWQENLATAQRLTTMNRRLSDEIQVHNDAQKALAESEERYRRLVDLSPNAIVVQIDGRIELGNAAAARLFGMSTAQALAGMPFLDLIHPDSRGQESARPPDTGQSGDRTDVELTLLRSDGRSFPARLSFVEIVLDGQAAVLSVLYDLTERKTAEQAMRHAAEAAEKANRAKSDFLANMSHELRSPLNSILGFAQLISESRTGGPGSVDQREFAGYIHSAGEHLLAVINDILDLSKVESGKLELREDSVDLEEIIGSCLILVAERAHTGGLKVNPHFDENLPSLRADPQKLKQVVINLLDNAVKFTPPGGRITIEALYEQDSGYELRVSDTGHGIEPDQVSVALERFGQVDSGPNRVQSGTGLGLPLTKALIELHGGSLELSSSLGEGTTVLVRLPGERALFKTRCRPAAVPRAS